MLEVCRRGRPEVFCQKGSPENLAKFTGRHLCKSLFLILDFAKFLRTPFLENTPGGCFCVFGWRCFVSKSVYSLYTL